MRDGSSAVEGWLSTDVNLTFNIIHVISIILPFPLLPLTGVAWPYRQLNNRTGQVCVCVCVCARVWFLESEDKLLPLLKAKQAAHNRLLQDDSMTNRRQFRKHQRTVKLAVVEAKEDWVRRVATKVKQAKKDGRQRWQGVNSCRWLLRDQDLY